MLMILKHAQNKKLHKEFPKVYANLIVKPKNFIASTRSYIESLRLTIWWPIIVHQNRPTNNWFLEASICICAYS
jgi:hypothetical protein